MMRILYYQSIAVALILTNTALATNHQLNLPTMVVYQPNTDVRDELNIDQDKSIMSSLTGTPTEASFAKAKKVYEFGAESGSYAVLNIGRPWMQFWAGTEVTGTSMTGSTIKGKLLKNTGMLSTQLLVAYAVESSQEPCYVGGLPSQYRVSAGCFRSSGTLKVGEYSITYSYTIEEDNKNNRSLRKFATGANREYRENRVGAYHSEFQKFVVYYGVPDFSDKIIMGALDNQIVQFTNAGTFNFKELGFVGRSIATQISALMITVLQLIGELENAVEECQTCSFPMETCSAVNSIDQAVAYYVGSLAQGLGNLMYTLADFSCMDFKTCGFAGESFFGASSVNLELFPSFEIMKYSIIEQQCSRARTHKDLLISKLFVPLIQSTLKSLYEMESLDHPTEEAEAQAFMYATSILPLVHNCNPKDASSILNHVRIGQEGKGRFAAVKKALENNYVCMKVTCEEIGGYYDGSVSRYYPGAEPCDYQSVMS